MIDPKVQRLLDLSGAKVIPFVQAIIESNNIPMEMAASVGGLYSPGNDIIAINPFCVDPNSVTLHELAHWTGHSSRLNRDGIRLLELRTNVLPSWKQTEEFVAQLTACKLLKQFNLDHHMADALMYKMIGWYAKGDMTKANDLSIQSCDYLMNIYNQVDQKVA